ncbi:MAG: endopeptidase La [Fusobacteriaceae bacterium]|nr:endopeptidase La [Fusobacteriaceae bacterium]MBP6322262.1 endopeptidase La [Fusobacteriaceae bacterium]MBP9509576.1 endopeptidase La [Fusobacteriaceae bacterium]
MKQLPFIPTRDMIIFPGVVTPLYVGRTLSIATIEKSVANKSQILLGMQKDPFDENPNLETGINFTGVVANIIQVVKMQNDTIKVLVEGDSRAHISDIQIINGEYLANYEILKPNNLDPNLTDALLRKVLKSFEQFASLAAKVPSDLITTMRSIKDLDNVFNVVSSHLPITSELKQELLSEVDLETRGYALLEILSQEIEISKLEKKLDDKVKDKLNTAQKNFYLKEKISAIKEEIGESADDDLKELEKEIKKAKLPKYAQKKAEAELKKLSKMASFSAEASVCRTYIETIISLPWSKESKDILDIKLASETLEKDHYGLHDVKDRILDYLAVKQLNPNTKGGILCLAGPPGVGKTSLVKSIAESMGRKFVRVSLGGVRDEAEIRGHRRTYVGSMPGRIIKALKEAGTSNPVILLDEIDKMASDFKGDPSSAMLEVLDPEQNYHFEDHYLDMPFDLSKVFFVATANDLRGVSAPLRDRMEIISLSSYTEFEKLHIAKKYLIKQSQDDNGLSKIKFEISDNTILKIINEYTREAGVRNLKREFNSLFRKLAREVIEKDKKKISITLTNLEKYLGKPKLKPEKLREKTLKQGVVNGLAWTAYGGTTLEVQGVSVNGKGALSLTGTLGNVMKESATVAFTYIKSHLEDFNLNETDFFEKKDIHLHFPEGATPKDGPSAGIAITTAILSVVSGRKIRQDVAMTGEVTITGEVLPIGGVKEKVIGAHRVGIREVILPDENRADEQDIPKEIKKDMIIHFVSTYKEVEEIILEKIDTPKKKVNKKEKVKKDAN